MKEVSHMLQLPQTSEGDVYGNYLSFFLHKYQLCTVCARDISNESEIELPIPNWTERHGKRNLARHVNHLNKTKCNFALVLERLELSQKICF